MEKRAVVTHSMVLSVKQPSRKVNFSKNSFKEVSCVIIICLHKINFQSTPCWGRVLVNHPWVIILTIFSYHWSFFPSKKRTVACLQGVLWRLKNPCSDLRLIQSIYRKNVDDRLILILPYQGLFSIWLSWNGPANHLLPQSTLLSFHFQILPFE